MNGGESVIDGSNPAFNGGPRGTVGRPFHGISTVLVADLS
jgi:hypothetical protein